MEPDKLDFVAGKLESELNELRDRAPRLAQREDKFELGWLARRGRRLHLAIEGRRSGPVLVMSIWCETEFGELFPVRDGQIELGAQQLPIFASLLAKGIRFVRDAVGERVACDDIRRAGGR